MKLTWSLAVCLATLCGAEPPVGGGYSTTFQDAFAPPPSGPSASYGAPPPPSAYGPPQTGRHTGAVLRPSPSYGAPSGFRGRTGFGGGSRFGGVASQGFGSSGQGGSFGSSAFGSSGFGSSGFGNGGSGGGGYSSGGNRRPSSNYGTPTGSGGNDEGNSEPASYQFSYHVKDAPSGNDFGHQESREGHVAKGMYMVLLPDGRRQIVEYTADETGYHPIVRYEGTATGSGYPIASGGNGGGNGGYRY